VRRRKGQARHNSGPSLKAGLIALVVIAVGCYFGFTKANPFADKFELSAAFRSANDIKSGSAVRVAGVNVGKVKSVETLDPSSQLGRRGAGAIVHMELDEAALPIKADARMKIRPRIFLEGNWFVDISPGSPSADALPEGATLPVQQTSAPVQFGQLLTALQSDTRQDLQIVLDEYGRALANGGARGYNRSIEHWTKAFRDSAIVNDATLGLETHDLSGYLRGAARFARGLDRDPRALKDLLTNLADTADAFASEERNLTAAIHELPRTLVAGRSALGELNGAFPSLRRFVADMRPAVRASGPSLDATLPLVKQLRGFVRKSELRGLVHDLRPVVPDLTELNEGGVGLQQELRLLSSCTNEVLTPWRNDTVPDAKFPASGPVYQEQVKWLPGIAAESRNFDANGQYVRSLSNGAQYAYGLNDGRFFLTGLPLQGVNPPKVAGPPPLNADVPCETQQPPDLNTVVQAPPKAIKVNNGAPAVVAAVARERAKAVRWLRRTLDSQDIRTRVLDRPLLRSQIGRLDRSPKR
jgi:phospholipid/cholesterol/gamma-HCH transport system substrate-binding protein